VCKLTGFVNQKWLDYRVIDCDWSLVTIVLNVTRVDFESPKIMTHVASLTPVTLSLVISTPDLPMHITMYFLGNVYFASWSKGTGGAISPLAKQDWLKFSWQVQNADLLSHGTNKHDMQRDNTIMLGLGVQPTVHATQTRSH